MPRIGLTFRSVPANAAAAADPAAAREELERVDREEQAVRARGSARRARRSPRRSCPRSSRRWTASAEHRDRGRDGARVDHPHRLARRRPRPPRRSRTCPRASRRAAASRSARSRGASSSYTARKSPGRRLRGRRRLGGVGEPGVELVGPEVDVVAVARPAEVDVERDDRASSGSARAPRGSRRSSRGRSPCSRRSGSRAPACPRRPRGSPRRSGRGSRPSSGTRRRRRRARARAPPARPRRSGRSTRVRGETPQELAGRLGAVEAGHPVVDHDDVRAGARRRRATASAPPSTEPTTSISVAQPEQRARASRGRDGCPRRATTRTHPPAELRAARRLLGARAAARSAAGRPRAPRARARGGRRRARRAARRAAAAPRR